MKKFSAAKAIAFTSEVGFASMAMKQVAFGATQLQQGATAAQPTGTSSDLFGANGLFRTISNTLIFIVGAVAVIMLIIGGLRYVLSSGNATSVEGAKNTILFAIIGIIVAILAFAIVQFVITKFGG